MAKQLEYYQEVERSVQKTFHKRLWTPFVSAIKQYKLIGKGDKIAVCISGGKDSMLLAVLLRMFQRYYSDVPFDIVYLCMDPGYNEVNRAQIEENAAKLQLPITFFETEIYNIAAETSGDSPCYLCARMRRGNLYAKARELGCNKIALGHHFDDVIETTLVAMFYGSQLQGMMPKLHSTNFEGMELIRPLYEVHEEDIKAWRDYNHLVFIQCACRFTENFCVIDENDPGDSKRKKMKILLRRLEAEDPGIKQSVFRAIHAVCLDTFPGYKSGGGEHFFLERYDSDVKNEAGHPAVPGGGD